MSLENRMLIEDQRRVKLNSFFSAYFDASNVPNLDLLIPVLILNQNVSDSVIAFLSTPLTSETFDARLDTMNRHINAVVFSLYPELREHEFFKVN